MWDSRREEAAIVKLEKAEGVATGRYGAASVF